MILNQIEENLWTFSAPVPRAPFNSVMSVIRREDGSLIVHGAMDPGEEGFAELDALGPVRAILTPNGYHRLFGHLYAQRYPDAKIYTPAGSRDRVQKKMRVDGDERDFPSDAQVAWIELEGVKRREAVLRFSSPEGTTFIICDLVFNMPHRGGVGGFMLKHVTASSGGPTISRIAKFGLIADKPAFAHQLRELVEEHDPQRVIVSHESPLPDPPRTLRGLAEKLA